MYFAARVDRVEGWSRVAVVGELDLATIGDFRRAIRQALASSTQLIVDLTALDFVDSLGLGLLVGAQRRAVAEGGELVVLCAEPRLLDVFAAARVDEIIDVRPAFDPATVAL